MKDNYLIAEFMGFKQPHPEYPNTTYWYKELPNGRLETLAILNYHISWDWLIPVMKKIDSYACEEMDFSDYDDYRNKYAFIHNISLHNDISDAYNQVVEFIKQHNK